MKYSFQNVKKILEKEIKNIQEKRKKLKNETIFYKNGKDSRKM